MKRKIVALALAAAMVMGLAGCGAKEEPAAPADTKTEAPAEEKEEAPAEVATWAPDGPVTVICPYGAGGGQDVAARIFAKYAEEYAGVKFVVENQTGGSGTIGTTAIATAKPDGYTLGMFHSLSFYDQYLVEGVAYTPESFDQLAVFAGDSTVIVANKSLGVTDLAGLVELAKSKPGEITWGGPEFSSQTYPRMNVETATGAEFGKMIFDGGAKALAAVAGGNCGVTSVFPSEYAAMADNPDIVAIAVTGTERSTSLPDVPTMQEQGIDATFFQLRSYCLPAGAPAEVVAFYGDIFDQVVNNADFQQEMVDGGFAPIAVAGSEASNKYMMDDFNANKDAVMAAAGVQ